MEIINHFFIEIIALIVILTLLVIVILLRGASKTTPYEPVDDTVLAKEDEIVSKDETEIEEQEPIPHKIEKEESTQELKTTHKTTENKPNISRVKREFINPGKITKDSFSDFDGVRILVAEDNMINQKVITSLLANSGIDVVVANDGQECVDILKNDTSFSVILMDAHMPIMDGFQATRYIRKNSEYEHIPIVALSGDTAADDIQNMLNVGMERHLEKPLRLDALYEILYIYTTGDESYETPETRETIKISEMEFDSAKGLDICGGDKDFFMEILNDFTNKYSESAETLKDNLNSSRSILADQELLDISGVAANIGADHLHTVSLELKNSIKNPDDMEYINLLKEFKRSLIDVIKLIKDYQDKN